MARQRGAGVEYLLLTNRERDEPGFPKGHVEGRESERDAARRETVEETGLTDFDASGGFRVELHYPVTRKGRRYDKTVVYFLAKHRSGAVRLSEEHSACAWLPLAEALEALPFESLRGVLRDAALWLKDPALFALEPRTEADALAHLEAQPEVTGHLVGHLQGAARLARRFAEGLVAAGTEISPEATAAGALLHDIGRALGRHADHQLAGLEHLRTTPLAAYGFACLSHFTKGASVDALVAAGVEADMLEAVGRLIDVESLTPPEMCVALADACMQGTAAVPPAERFADLRARYDAEAIIALQERRTEIVRRDLEAAISSDPLALVGLA